MKRSDRQHNWEYLNVAKRSKRNPEFSAKEFSWNRVRSIFGNPSPPKSVWQRQFDHFDDELRKLASTPYDEIDFQDLWYYHHDLAYSELQSDLFDYLFPVCLMDWHTTLMNNEACSHGDSEFHKGVHQGQVFELMLSSPQQQAKVFGFMRDSFLERLDHERGFQCEGGQAMAHRWIYRLNSMGLVLPTINDIWAAWWALDTPGKAVAALEYCSGLMYLEGGNPLFGPYTQENGGGGPYLWENDSYIYSSEWLQANLDFLTVTLTPEFVNKSIRAAVERLRGEPEWEKALMIEADLFGNQEWISVQDLIASRTAELPLLLSGTGTVTEWSM